MYFANFTSIETLNCLIQIYVASCTSIIGYIIMHNVNSVRNFEHYIKREYYSMSFCCILLIQRMQSFFIMTERHLCFTFTSNVTRDYALLLLASGDITYRVFILSKHATKLKIHILSKEHNKESRTYKCIIIKNFLLLRL